MARRVLTGCRDCKRCTNSDVANLGRNAGSATLALTTLGMSSMAKATRKKCRACGHQMSLHNDDLQQSAPAPGRRAADRKAPDPDKPLLLQPTVGALLSEARRRRQERQG